ncbi:DNA internalization-related competence protein ComEC/Rec2 [Longimonas halophila]|nr:DNA internalization-related competence protein ComEC/Rec2 [Longimonas halophila]
MSDLNTIPLLACAVACGTGVALAAAGWGSFMLWGVVFLGAAGACVLGLLWQCHHLVSLGPLIHTLALLVVMCAAGGARYLTWQDAAPNSLRTLPDSLLHDAPAVQVVGTVEGPVFSADTGTRFVLAAQRLLTSTDTLHIRDRIQVRWQTSLWDDDPPSFPDVVAGDRWTMTGRLQPPPPPRNPADFDYGAYLRQHGIHWTLAVDRPADVEQQAEAPLGYARTVHEARRYVSRTLQTHVPTEVARSIQHALLLGDRSEVDDAHRTAFAHTGLMHLLAVSGLHVLLVGMLAYQLLRPVLMRLGWSRRRVDAVRAVFTLMLLLTYMAITGGRPSVVRATLMAALLIGGTLTNRVYASLNALGAAALVLLWMRPAALYDPGFQLSFAAVIGIVLFNPKLMGLLPGAFTHGTARRFFTQSVTVSTAALLGTTPFLLLHFGFASGAGLLLNVAAIPLTALALAAGVLTVATSALPQVAHLFGGAADILTQLLLLIAQAGAAWFGHWQWAVPHVSSSAVAFMVAGLLIFGGMRTWRLWHGLAAGLAVAVFLVWIPLTSRPLSPTLDVLFFDVGQSDAALVRTPDGQHLLVDAGYRTPHFNAATSALLPHLRYTGTSVLDAVLITHPDTDHMGGLPALLRAGVAKAVWDNGQLPARPLQEEAAHLANVADVPYRSIEQGDTLQLGKHARVVAFAPPSAEANAVLQSSNNRSAVAALQYGDVQMLFAGDVEAEAERWLVETYGYALRSDVVTVPHHGSSTSSTPAFLEATTHAETHAVISAGDQNQFDFPNPAVVGRWRNRADAVHETADRAVWLRTDGNCVWRVDW